MATMRGHRDTGPGCLGVAHVVHRLCLAGDAGVIADDIATERAIAQATNGT
jgi:hypothetical protein